MFTGRLSEGGPFQAVYTKLLETPGITSRRLHVWLFWRRNGGADHVTWPSYQDCADSVCCSRDQAKRDTEWLRDHGWLFQVRWSDEKRHNEEIPSLWIVYPASPENFTADELIAKRGYGRPKYPELFGPKSVVVPGAPSTGTDTEGPPSLTLSYGKEERERLLGKIAEECIKDLADLPSGGERDRTERRLRAALRELGQLAPAQESAA